MEMRCSNPECGSSLALFSQTFQHPTDKLRYCSLSCLKRGARQQRHAQMLRQTASLSNENNNEMFFERREPAAVKPSRRPSAAQRLRDRYFRQHESQRIQSELKRLQGKRAYFFWWNIVVLSAVLVLSLTLYSLAPIGFADSTEYAQVTGANSNPLLVVRNVSKNIFIGPGSADMVRLGAMFSPCVRSDKKIKQAFYDPLSVQEASYGCCLRQTGTVCYSSTASGCLGLQDYTNTSCYGAICCINPADYPTCQRIPAANLPPDTSYDVCRCSLVARPCCRGLYGDCVLATQEQCKYYGGFYASDKTACSQVDCLESTCGLGPFSSSFNPDQWYRLILANFLTSGLCHYLMAMFAFTSIGLDLEQTIGWWRYGLIYMISGVGGYCISGIFTPYQINCGPFPCVFGLLGALVVELFNAWQKAAQPWHQFFKLTIALALALAVGLLPYINNFSHIGGLVFGTISAFVLLPWQAFGSVDRARKRIFALLALIGLVALSVTVLTLLFTIQDFTCSICEAMDCVNFVDGFCSGMGQGAPF